MSLLIDVMKGKYNNIGRIILDATNLNALNHNMVQQITATLEEWQYDDSIFAVAILSNNDKAFCAGGDIKSVYYQRHNIVDLQNFFADEYYLNQLIAEYTKPYLAFVHGITMGGGIGISLHGQYRIADSKTILAMPETTIGFFPDIGSSYFFNKFANNIGKYFALTANIIPINVAKYHDLVNHIVCRNDFNNIILHIANTAIHTKNRLQSISDIIKQYTVYIDEYTINNCDRIAQYFASNNIIKIYDNLLTAEKECAIAAKIIKILQQKSPISLAVTAELLYRTKNYSLAECLSLDKHLIKKFLANNEFYEGIRAAVIDKDKNPQWHVKKISDLSIENVISEYFDDFEQPTIT